MNLIPDRVSGTSIGAALLVGVIFPVPGLVLAALAGAGAFLLRNPKRATLLYVATALAAASIARLAIHWVFGTFLM
ncbi:MAG: hypothetical protein BMS9Abin17_0800 [Acidimicrobiia bacterium]|nr:MAG: hypothetical protein BMS9Abin17_0800 [Acidimicrobiia bacterium]